MPHISTRGRAMPASPIRKLVPYAEAAKQKGVTVYPLHIGQPDIDTPPLALDAVRHFDKKILAYSHSAGNEGYRRKLVTYYERNGIVLDPAQIIVTTGGSEAILFAFMAGLDPGDEVIIPEPFYANYNGFAIQAGVTIVPVTSSITSGFMLPPVTAFEEAITPRTRAILICHPDNPTGHLYTNKELEMLKGIILRYDLYLFSDEAYREFCYADEHISALRLKGADEHIVLLDTISKRYSACGARLGAFITRSRTLLDHTLKFAQARLSPPSLAQILGEAAIDLPPEYSEHMKAEYVKRRDLLVRRLNTMPGVHCPTPGGAFYVMAQLPIDDTDKFCQWLLEFFSYNNQTVMLAPATGFYCTPGLGKKEVRLAYVLSTALLNKAMDCLERALAAYNQYNIRTM